MSWFRSQQRRKCLACGQSYRVGGSFCPVCLVPAGQARLIPVSQGGPVQIARTYSGNHALRAFQRESYLLRKAGWIITSQSMGGQNAYKIGSRPPTLISVTYGQAPAANQESR